MVEGVQVKADGEEGTLHITDQSVMFEKGGRVSGFERSAIRMVKPEGDVMIIAYSVGSEVKSVRVQPLTAVATLLASGSSSSNALTPATDLDQVFEKLYWDTRKELEEKLARVETEPMSKMRALPRSHDIAHAITLAIAPMKSMRRFPPVGRVITRFAVLISIGGRVMTFPETVPTWQTPLPAEVQGMRKEDAAPPETR